MNHLTRRHVMTGIAAVAVAGALPLQAIASVPTEASAPVDEAVRKVFVAPAMFRDELNRFAEENTYTILHDVMERWEFEGKSLQIQVARVGSDTYREWLEVDPPEDGIPPHIQFGGAVVAGEGDPTFHARWVERTLAKLKSGELA